MNCWKNYEAREEEEEEEEEVCSVFCVRVTPVQQLLHSTLFHLHVSLSFDTALLECARSEGNKQLC